MSNYEKIFRRENGTEAKILVLGFSAPFKNKQAYEACVFSRESKDAPWTRILDTPERKKLSKVMSVDTFIKEGRHPIFNVVSPIEIMVSIDEAMKIQ